MFRHGILRLRSLVRIRNHLPALQRRPSRRSPWSSSSCRRRGGGRSCRRVEQRSIPIGKTLGEAHPAALAGDTLTLEFPPNASFHLRVAEDPKNAAMLRDALYEVTGRKLAVAFELGETGHSEEEDEPTASEEDVLELMKSTFDARELDE